MLLGSDATQDVRFADFPGVTGFPHARFYAGVPLQIAEGLRLGALCVADVVPRQDFEHAQIAGLLDLAAEVMQLLELHRSKSEIAALQAQLSAQRAELNQSHKLWRKTEQRAMLALEAGKMGYWKRDATTDLVTFSSSLSAIMGLEPRDHQFSMDDWFHSIHEDDRANVLEIVETAARTQENYLLKYRTRGPDGKERWLSSSATYRQDASGNFSGAQGVSWDSTAAEETACKLMVKEELFRGLSESVPVGVFCSDLEGRMTYASPRTAAICERPAEELLCLGWFENVHPADQVRMMEIIAVAGTALTSTDDEFRLLLADGTIRWVQSRTSIMSTRLASPLTKFALWTTSLSAARPCSNSNRPKKPPK